MSSTQYQLGFDDLLNKLPSVSPIRVDVLPRGESTCFIAILGFEARCYAAAKQLADAGWKCQQAICVHYSNLEMREKNFRHRDEMYAALNQVNEAAEITKVEHDDQNIATDVGEALTTAINESGLDCDSSSTHVILDISVGSSRMLLEGLIALLHTNVSLTVLYSESSTYRPTFDEYLKSQEIAADPKVSAPEFLTFGVERVEILKAVPGTNADSRPTYLIAIPSFSAIRTGAVIEELLPSRVQWLFGIPNLIENRWRLDMQRTYHRNLVDQSHRHCYVGTLNYKETFEVLEQIYHKRRDKYTLLVCSLGSKCQKLGQALFHILRPEVGAVVSVPKKWETEGYSGATPRLIYSMCFGSCEALRQLLRKTRTLKL